MLKMKYIISFTTMLLIATSSFADTSLDISVPSDAKYTSVVVEAPEPNTKLIESEIGISIGKGDDTDSQFIGLDLTIGF